MDIVNRVPRELRAMIYRELHQYNLKRCLQEIFKYFKWNDNRQYYETNDYNQMSFNYRKYDDDCNFVWRLVSPTHIVYTQFRCSGHKLPDKYIYSSGKHHKAAYK